LLDIKITRSRSGLSNPSCQHTVIVASVLSNRVTVAAFLPDCATVAAVLSERMKVAAVIPDLVTVFRLS
jgi:hypothetical protein